MQQLGRADAVEDVDTDSGSASPAEVQMRRRLPARSFFSASSFSIAANNVGTPKKMVGLYLFSSENISGGVGRSELRIVLAPTDIGNVSALPRP
jgi:hypothetical protein